MIKVLFKNSNGQEREIAEVKTIEAAHLEINKFCSERDFTINYKRCWKRENRTVVDVGSHYELFYIVETT